MIIIKPATKSFQTLTGYKSPKEWADVDASLADVVEEDQQSVIDVYINASEKMIAGSVDVRIKNIKTRKIIKTRMIVFPVGHAGQILTAHFFNKI